MRIGIEMVLVMIVLGFAPLRAEDPAASVASLEDLLSLVEERNPEAAAAREEAESLGAREGPAGRWPDPEIGMAWEKMTVGDRITHVRAAQDIPFPGKKSREAAAVAAEGEIAKRKAGAVSLALRARARSLAFRVQRSTRIARRLEEEIALVDSLAAALRSRLAAGEPVGDEIFSLEAERGRMANGLLAERQGGRAARQELNSLLDRPLDAPLPEFPAPVPNIPADSLAALTERALRAGPASLAAEQEVNRALSIKSRAGLSYAPDVSVLLDGRRDDAGRTGYEAGFMASLPLWGERPAGERKEAAAGLRAARAAARASQNEVARAVAAHLGEVTLLAEQARTYERAILPAARSAFALSRRRYEGGRGGFDRLLESLRTLVASEIEYQNTLAAYAEHWGELERWVGGVVEGAKE